MNIARGNATILVVSALFLTTSKIAPCEDTEKRPPSLQLGASAQGAASTRQVCAGEGEAEFCSSFFTLLGFQAEAHYRFPVGWLSVGLLGGNGWHVDQAIDIYSNGEVGVTRTLIWRMGVEGRGYPLVWKWLTLWCGIELGFARAVHFYDHTPGGTTRLAETGPSMGIGVGLDFRVVRELHIGAELRFLYWGFENPPEPPEGGKPVPKDFGHAVWPTFAIRFSYLFSFKKS